MSNPNIDILYVCDRKACENCSEECRHTGDIEHAVNRNKLDGMIFQCRVSGDRMGLFEIEPWEWDHIVYES